MELIDNNSIQDIPTLDKLSQLQALTIVGNKNLQNLPSLSKLPQLEKLTLSANKTLQKQLLKIAKGLTHLSVLYPSLFVIMNELFPQFSESIPLNLSPFFDLPNLRLVCVDTNADEQWDEARKFVQRRKEAKMPEVTILEMNYYNVCKL